MRICNATKGQVKEVSREINTFDLIVLTSDSIAKQCHRMAGLLKDLRGSASTEDKTRITDVLIEVGNNCVAVSQTSLSFAH
jgi:hypothetical protein